MALSAVFHSTNPLNNSSPSHFVFLVLFLLYWSFQLHISLWTSVSALILSFVVDSAYSASQLTSTCWGKTCFERCSSFRSISLSTSCRRAQCHLLCWTEKVRQHWWLTDLVSVWYCVLSHSNTGREIGFYRSSRYTLELCLYVVSILLCAFRPCWRADWIVPFLPVKTWCLWGVNVFVSVLCLRGLIGTWWGCYGLCRA